MRGRIKALINDIVSKIFSSQQPKKKGETARVNIPKVKGVHSHTQSGSGSRDCTVQRGMFAPLKTEVSFFLPPNQSMAGRLALQISSIHLALYCIEYNVQNY